MIELTVWPRRAADFARARVVRMRTSPLLVRAMLFSNFFTCSYFCQVASLKAGAAAAAALWDWELSADKTAAETDIQAAAAAAEGGGKGAKGLPTVVSADCLEDLTDTEVKVPGEWPRPQGAGLPGNTAVDGAAASATAVTVHFADADADGPEVTAERPPPASFGAAEQLALRSQQRAQREQEAEEAEEGVAAWSEDENAEADRSADTIEGALKRLPSRLSSGASAAAAAIAAAAAGAATAVSGSPRGHREEQQRNGESDVTVAVPGEEAAGGSRPGRLRNSLQIDSGRSASTSTESHPDAQPPLQPPPPTPRGRPAADFGRPLSPQEAAERAMAAQRALVAALAAQRRVLDEAAAEPKWMPTSQSALSARSAALLSDAQAAQVQLLGLLRSAIATIADDGAATGSGRSEQENGIRELLEPCAPAVAAVRDACAELFVSAAEVWTHDSCPCRSVRSSPHDF